jgi:hypothetical protein
VARSGRPEPAGAAVRPTARLPVPSSGRSANTGARTDCRRANRALPLGTQGSSGTSHDDRYERPSDAQARTKLEPRASAQAGISICSTYCRQRTSCARPLEARNAVTRARRSSWSRQGGSGASGYQTSAAHSGTGAHRAADLEGHARVVVLASDATLQRDVQALGVRAERGTGHFAALVAEELRERRRDTAAGQVGQQHAFELVVVLTDVDVAAGRVHGHVVGRQSCRAAEGLRSTPS